MNINPYAALAELCRRSFYRFLQEFWHVVIPEDPVWNWHIKYICDELQYLNSFVERREPKPYDLVINIPPGTTKSTIVTQMYNAWVWTRDPSQRFIATSYAHALALSQAIKTRDIVTSDKYKLLFPEFSLKKDQSGKGDFVNNAGGQRFTTSTGGTVTGMHGHQIICLPYERLISTDKGELMMGDIVEKQIKCRILSYNEVTREAEYKPILKYEKNPFRQLVRVTTAKGKVLECTEDHLVFTHNRGYVEAKNLKEHDEIELLPTMQTADSY